MEHELIEFIVKSIVDKPDEVRVEAKEDETGLVLELRVAPEDIGRVIGRQGRIAKAMRTLLAATAYAGQKHISLHILE